MKKIEIGFVCKQKKCKQTFHLVLLFFFHFCFVSVLQKKSAKQTFH